MTEYIEQFWRAAAPEDAIKHPPMVARFRSIDGEGWKTGTLQGYRTIRYGWCRDAEIGYWERDCEVYDEPYWYKNKPEPGEGYRLLEKFPEPERLVDGDEFLVMNGQWSAVLYVGEITQHFAVWYRRKIEPAAVQENTNEVAKYFGDWYRRWIQSAAVAEAKAEPIMAEFEVAAPDEHVKLVTHPIHQDDNGQWRFKNTPIQDRSYAVLNNRGYYLQWLAGKRPEYQPEFRHAFTPARLLQVSIRELGRNIRLRAVEPGDADKLQQEIRQELRFRLVQQNRQVSYQSTEGCYQLPGDAVIEYTDRYVSEDGSVWGPTLESTGKLVSSQAEPYYRPVLNFTPKRGWEFKGEKLEHVAYAVVNADGKFLQCDDEHGIGFTDRLRQTWTPSALVNLNMLVLAECKLVQVQPVHVDPFKQKLGGPDVDDATGKVYEHNGHKFRLATSDDVGQKVFTSDVGIEKALERPARELEGTRNLSNGDKEFAARGYWKYAFIEITEPKPPRYVPFRWEDRHLLRNRYIRRKGELYRESCVQDIDQHPDGTCVVRLPGSLYAFEDLLEKCEFDDGTPCGKRVEQ